MINYEVKFFLLHTFQVTICVEEFLFICYLFIVLILIVLRMVSNFNIIML